MNPTILIVEDEWLVAEGLKMDLEEQGCRVLGPALSCKDALSILEDHKVQMAILDTELSGETCEAVLEECEKNGIPVIIFSGHLEQDFPQFARGRKVLMKPYDPAALAEVLAQ
jgi:DNA-binding response OmpR family regulator